MASKNYKNQQISGDNQNNIHSQVQNIVSYQKQIKSNNGVFQQNQLYLNQGRLQQQQQNYPLQQQQVHQQKQSSSQNANQVNSPQKIPMKNIIINATKSKIATNSTGNHRRSKTDGNVNINYNPSNQQEDQMRQMKNHMENNFSIFQQENQNSRQAVINNSDHIKKLSNQSAKSANFSMEQAAKNLKLMNNEHLHNVMQAPTRNSNLQSQPNKDKIQNKQIYNMSNSYGGSGGSMNQQNQNHQQERPVIINKNQQEAKPQSAKINIDDDMRYQNNNFLTANGQVSVQQLKELMKNPQIARFLKEQIDLQQKQAAESNDVQNGTSKNKHDDGNSQISWYNQINGVQSQQYQICDMTQDSNLNSDTSQEILKYQIEWAKQFHEQVQYPTTSNNQSPFQVQMQTRGPDLQKHEAEPDVISSSQVSQMIHYKMDDSQNQIPILPRSSEVNAMQNLNSRSDQKSNEEKINFYNDSRQNTDNSQVQPAQFLFDNKQKGADFTHSQSDARQEDIDEIPPMLSETWQEDQKSRNILNGGKQLSLMTVQSDVFDNSADLLFEYFQEDSEASQKDEEDEYLTFQLCEGEEMNNEMANFIGIHMLNDGQVDGTKDSKIESKTGEEEGGLTYQCPQTGSHFEFMDLIGRMRNLKQKRVVIDEAILEEDKRKAQSKGQNDKKQKQIQKQKKLKTQVQNILKSAAQEFSENDDNINDSIKHTAGNIMTTDEDVLILGEEENLLQTHNLISDNQNGNMIQQNYKVDKHSTQNKIANKIYNTHDGRQKQALDQQNNKQYQNNQAKEQQKYQNQQYFDSQNQEVKYGMQMKPEYTQHQQHGGRTVGNGASHSQNSQKVQPNSVNHQAGSLASNHASKISHFSKITQQAGINRGDINFQSQPSPNQNVNVNLHDQQQQMIMNLKYQMKDKSNNQAELVYQMNKIQHSMAQQHHRGQSDDMNSIQPNFIMQGNTQIHSNKQTSLIGSHGNTNSFNTALGSQRGENKLRSVQMQQKGVYSTKNNKKQPLIKNNKFSSHPRKTEGTLKQTAQFGPQMNLIKSQLPHQMQVGNNQDIYRVNATDRSQPMVQQKNNSNKLKSDHLNQNQQVYPTPQQHYMTASYANQASYQTKVTSLSAQRQMQIQNNKTVQLIQQQSITSQQDKRTSGKTKALIQNKPDIPSKQSLKHPNSSKINTQTQIYQTQQQRKTKLIQGGNQIAGQETYTMGTVSGGPNAMSSSHYQTTGVQSNSIGRSDQKINNIPNSVGHTVKQKYQNHLNNNIQEHGIQNVPIQGDHLQSHSFDYRQQSSQYGQSQTSQALQNNMTEQTNISKKMMVANTNNGIVRHSKNMRSFDVQRISQNQNNTNQQQEQIRKQYNSGSNYQANVNKTQGTGSFVKQKSSSLNNPKEQPSSSNQNQRISNPGQLVISQGNMGSLAMGDSSKAGNFHQGKTADHTNQSQNDNLYKSMHKKVKSTLNQGQIHQNDGQISNQQKLRMSYNSAILQNQGKNNTQKKYTPQGKQGQNIFDNKVQMQNDQYNMNLNQNINAFDEQIQLLGSDQNDAPGTVLNSAKNMIMSKSKRITAATRGVTSGTNARVNTFDNRGIQASQQQNQQQSQSSVRQSQVNQKNNGIDNNGMHQQQQQQSRPSSNQAHQNQQQPSQTKLMNRNILNSQQNKNMSTRNDQQQSPKKNIYLLNYQGNVSII